MYDDGKAKKINLKMEDKNQVRRECDRARQNNKA
jgi:hypothetical protein